MAAANPDHPAFEQLTWAAASARCTGGYSSRTIHTSPPRGNWALCAGGGYGGDILMPRDAGGSRRDAIMWIADAHMSDYNCKGMGCGCESPPRLERCLCSAFTPGAGTILLKILRMLATHDRCACSLLLGRR